jgi:N-acetylmuramoyl-L-alanine amidase
MKKLTVLLVLIAAFWCVSNTETNTKPNIIRKIIIDAGHGGKDPGCSGHKHLEKDVSLKISQMLGANIKIFSPTVEVVYTRSRDEFIALHDRARKSNSEKGQLFISIHANAATTPNMYGTETYILGLDSKEESYETIKRENASILQEIGYQKNYKTFDPNSVEAHILIANQLNAYKANSLLLAGKVENYSQHGLNRHSRGVKQAHFYVLKGVDMPAILFEVGFLTNPIDGSYVGSTAGQGDIADELYRAIRDYIIEYEKR